MTMSFGYFCPKCRLRWVRHLCKDGNLPCGCGVSTDDAVYICTKHYARSGDGIYIRYKDFELDAFLPHGKNRLEDMRNLMKIAEDHPEAGLLKSAIANALSGRSLYSHHWRARCARCANAKDIFSKRPCDIQEFPSVACNKFEERR